MPVQFTDGAVDTSAPIAAAESGAGSGPQRLADGTVHRADLLAGHRGFKGSLWHEYRRLGGSTVVAGQTGREPDTVRIPVAHNRRTSRPGAPASIPTRWPRRAVLRAGPLAVAALLAGCGGGQVDPAVAGAGDAAIPSWAPGLFTVNSQRLGGPIVIDGQGYAVYRSDADAADPSRSACTGGCITTWPPLAAGDLGRLRVVGMDLGPGEPAGPARQYRAAHPLRLAAVQLHR